MYENTLYSSNYYNAAAKKNCVGSIIIKKIIIEAIMFSIKVKSFKSSDSTNNISLH